ncbi:hypothetical protein [Streptomyces sp. Isolate_45]|uniref:hypothetical protein n=1 Tax=Streptomyces sp. Isolate_45 TaxID=2950111 RepID=UPI00248205C2|nr:hypothetical protein [Streptomyces sp. Isolate_45]MDA5279538.1 hypothetical protein [Streptomyces sp. Isolate_45]
MSATNATKATHAANATNAAGATTAAGPVTAAPTAPIPTALLDEVLPARALNAANASKRLGLGLLGALLAGGLLLAACSVPDDRTHTPDPGDVVLPHRGGPRK